jgi:hypothetical protein
VTPPVSETVARTGVYSLDVLQPEEGTKMSTLHRRIRRTAVLMGMAVLLPFVTADSVAAQYFGRNQVQYRTFDFRILKTENFDVYHYPEADPASTWPNSEWSERNS